MWWEVDHWEGVVGSGPLVGVVGSGPSGGCGGKWTIGRVW